MSFEAYVSNQTGSSIASAAEIRALQQGGRFPRKLKREVADFVKDYNAQHHIEE